MSKSRLILTTTMLRTSLTQTVRSASLLARRQAPSHMRFNSTQPPAQEPPPVKTEEQEALTAARRWADDMRRDWDAKKISYEELKPKALNPSEDAFLIDVREQDEVIQGMIPSAVNLPLSKLGNALHLPANKFLQEFGFTKPKPTQEVTFYCRSGKRSTSACDVAKRNGYTNVLNYEGSWMEWISKEKP